MGMNAYLDNKPKDERTLLDIENIFDGHCKEGGGCIGREEGVCMGREEGAWGREGGVYMQGEEGVCMHHPYKG